MKLLSVLVVSAGSLLPIAAGTSVSEEGEIVYSAPIRHVQEMSYDSEETDVHSYVQEDGEYGVDASLRILEEVPMDESFEGAEQRSLGKKKQEPVVIEMPAKKAAPVKKPVVETKYMAPVVESKYVAPSKKGRLLAALSGRRQTENETVSSQSVESVVDATMTHSEESVMTQSEEESVMPTSTEDSMNAQSVEMLEESAEVQGVQAAETETEEERELKKKATAYVVPVAPVVQKAPTCTSGKSCSSYHSGCTGNACSRYMQESAE
ncbi:hypothetical protein TGPRC2_237070 [Toxoplasma gondii TgCatPRC2]|uniref:Uncharacterized protein n=14 Tax=Toxoplasma gondii TaxID=5811 RepID=B9PVW2_TOXGV|nr:hypothetical protein TGME49_237070 [Toxoplasma gondii ME49]EPR60101.1 hypothetical protein TGGT1_237070 [Toxoplasma gondii GT1]ESS31050.1 hypothetical protein TGVEG_237070 [Toxoplasma gondii VEG]KAF4640162.1 hypothetical protein TGRH88_040870 [Toxoplasma gondii]KFG31785.1 hypothetical protein TGDOM2_237070 [Toxoplasma gondii GAB2-2007-GAL-DOM2]KFG44145.1 hypothetical protein TGFOU_237070 [Toxoplasma gondii FOU]KFG62370.1 hypothetical protein TGRUB_237070 [Toxoplasma gondii RUB]KFH07579.1 |eukprot:XP_002369059.1 hypothetical protein TGME49_237070 [Toxoplasma gondii ME49]